MQVPVSVPVATKNPGFSDFPGFSHFCASEKEKNKLLSVVA